MIVNCGEVGLQLQWSRLGREGAQVKPRITVLCCVSCDGAADCFELDSYGACAARRGA